MKIHSRRIFVWLISFLVVIVAYKLYTIFNQTPTDEMETATSISGDSPDIQKDPNEKMGSIAGIDLGPTEKAVFYDKNPETGENEREFGYDRMANVEGSEWEIEKPYMNIYRSDLTCKITAERGRVIIEDAVERISPSDATLTGNVVIHIEPKEASKIGESFLYLNDIVFISEQSKITSTGPVRFVSDNARLNGRGMELVYNNELGRLEFLRIVQLESLRIRSEEKSLLSSQQNMNDTSNTIDSRSPQNVSDTQQTSDPVQNGTNEQNDFYKCIFNKNVRVQTPGQIIAADKISLNNILNISDNGEQVQTQKNDTNESQTGEAGTPKSLETVNENLSSRQAFEVLVTCDEGIVVIPSGHIDIKELSSQDQSFSEVFIKKKSEELLKESGQLTTYVSSTLDYFVQSGDTIALGPSELTFYISDLFDTTTSVPATINAKEKVTFIRTENKVVFEGDCVCSMVRENEGIEERYTVTAPRITVKLYQQNTKSSDMPTTIDNIVADGGTVRLSTVKKEGDKLLGGVELKCNRFDYFAEEQYLVAAGPGIIKADNSNAEEKTDKKANPYSLQRRCYALVENFDTLTYFLKTNWIVAKAGDHQMSLGYVPVLDDGKTGPATRAYSGIIEAYLYEPSNGSFEIKNLKAQQGVVYESEDIQFEGSEMLYNTTDSLVLVQGNESNPCFLNGAAVDGIEYNLITGKIKAKVIAPGMFQLSR
ncbi:MAG: hypothetical protein ACYTE8_05470 [Planctomycetota bacterium]|jgi:hypothetical protein